MHNNWNTFFLNERRWAVENVCLVTLSTLRFSFIFAQYLFFCVCIFCSDEAIIDVSRDWIDKRHFCAMELNAKVSFLNRARYLLCAHSLVFCAYLFIQKHAIQTCFCIQHTNGGFVTGFYSIHFVCGDSFLLFIYYIG